MSTRLADLEKQNISLKSQLSNQLVKTSRLTTENSALTNNMETDYQQLVEQIQIKVAEVNSIKIRLSETVTRLRDSE